MVEPIVVPRAGHPISRRAIDPDALKVLHRLRDHHYVAYLVGGSVRDLLLSRPPKDFDIGTSAHPYEIKRLFRNCWIIGRRFRLAHIKFGPKIIEVATFRRGVPAGTEADPPSEAAGPGMASAPERGAQPLHHENTFGTPEEDAFRRDFTINALFYDIATFSIIDYVGGLGDLQARLIRCIGDPDDRFREDPVRMLRAIALAARLDFHIDPPIYEALARQRTEIGRAAPARLLEELYKILRGGAAERTFRALADVGLLELMARELDDLQRGSNALWRSLARLDAYRARFSAAPDTLANPILLGTLVVPLGTLLPPAREAGEPQHGRRRVTVGRLPIAGRDIERLQQIVALQRRLLHPRLPYRAQRSLLHRPAFKDALTWLEIHGESPDAVHQWRALTARPDAAPGEEAPPRPRRRRRRRRRRRYPAHAVPPPHGEHT